MEEYQVYIFKNVVGGSLANTAVKIAENIQQIIPRAKWETLLGDQKSVNLMGFTDGKPKSLNSNIILANGTTKRNIEKINNKFVSLSNSVLQISDNLEDWNTIDLSPFVTTQTSYSQISYGNGVYIMSGVRSSNHNSNKILRSTDLTNWTEVTVSNGSYSKGFYSNGKFYILGSSVLNNQPSIPMVTVSSDGGLTWTILYTRDSIDPSINMSIDEYVVFGDFIQIAGGNSERTFTITSFDGGDTFTLNNPTTLTTVKENTLQVNLTQIYKLGNTYHGNQRYKYESAPGMSGIIKQRRVESTDLINWTVVEYNIIVIYKIKDTFVIISEVSSNNYKYRFTYDFLTFSDPQNSPPYFISDMDGHVYEGDFIITSYNSNNLSRHKIVPRVSFENIVEEYRINGVRQDIVDKVLNIEIPSSVDYYKLGTHKTNKVWLDGSPIFREIKLTGTPGSFTTEAIIHPIQTLEGYTITEFINESDEPPQEETWIDNNIWNDSQIWNN